jgi:hypothetical protein
LSFGGRGQTANSVIACGKREAFAQGSQRVARMRPMTGSATMQSILSLRGKMDCFAPLAMTI